MYTNPTELAQSAVSSAFLPYRPTVSTDVKVQRCRCRLAGWRKSSSINNDDRVYACSQRGGIHKFHVFSTASAGEKIFWNSHFKAFGLAPRNSAIGCICPLDAAEKDSSLVRWAVRFARVEFG
jgi:hypothetical protein